jgi:hypothetical protein
MKNTARTRELLNRFKHFLKGMKLDIDHPAFTKALEFLRELPGDITKYETDELRRIICATFGVTDEELSDAVLRVEEAPSPKPAEETSLFGDYDIVKAEDELRSLIPPAGFLTDYLKYVENTEPPLAYHVFAALLAAGAVLGGRVHIDMGVYQLFPPLAVMILGPSGVIKTKSADVAVGMLEEIEYPKIYSEMATPQALALDMAEMSQGVIYAPELTAFLTRDRFMDGMVTFITRALDHPRPKLRKRTVGGGYIVLDEPTASMLSCSTLDWLVEKTPEGTFGGGFMARQILVMQEDSPRIVSRPSVNKDLRKQILSNLVSLMDYSGKISFTKEADDAYDHWYHESKPKWKNPEVELMSTIYRRRVDNVQRVACILHLSHCAVGDICLRCFQRAAGLLEWTDQFTIPALKRVFKSSTGKDQEIVLRTIRSMGGVVEHSALVRRLQYRMNAHQLKVVINSLIDARQVEERQSKLQHTYFLRD